jgi:formate dehydrogenase major subunit
MDVNRKSKTASTNTHTKKLCRGLIDGKTIHQVGIPWHFGWITTKDRDYKSGDKKAEVFTFGDATNLLTPTIGDPNTTIPESKAFMVNVAKK